MKLTKIISTSLASLALIFTPIINTAATYAEDNITYTDFTIKKVDQYGNPVEGAEFEIWEEIPIVGNGAKTVEVIKDNKLFFLTTFIAFSLDSDNIYNVIIDMGNVKKYYPEFNEEIKWHADYVGGTIRPDEITYLNIEKAWIIDRSYMLYLDYATLENDFDNCIETSTPVELSNLTIKNDLDIVFSGKLGTVKHLLYKGRTNNDGKYNFTYSIPELYSTWYPNDVMEDYKYIYIKEIRVPEGYEATETEKQVNIRETNEVTFVNNKIIKEEEKEENKEPEINVPNTGGPTNKTNAMLIPVSIIGTFLGALFIAILPKLHRKKITFKK